MNFSDINKLAYLYAKKVCIPINTAVYSEEITTCIKNMIYKMQKYYNSYRHVPSGKALHRIPNRHDLASRMYEHLDSELERFKRSGYVKAVDVWSEMAGVNANYNFTEKPYDCPRYKGVKLTEKEYMENRINELESTLSEMYIVSFLNYYGFRCPVCSHKNSVGLCSLDENSSSFRDAVCLECKRKGVVTLYEIKCRNENKIAGVNRTNGGDWHSINTLLKDRCNVYVILYSRDTGAIRICRIYKCFMNLNLRFLYGIQEKKSISMPSSTIEYGSEVFKCIMPKVSVFLTKEELEHLKELAVKKYIRE